MENIKVTFLPNNESQGYTSLLKSVTDLAIYDTELINPHIIYNSDLDIDIERSDSTLSPYIRYIDINDLYSTLNGIILSEDETVIIIYGYDLSLDDVRNNIFNLVDDNEDIFLSVNILCDDKDLKHNIHLYFDSSKCSDEEWEEERNEALRIYEENKNTEEDESTISFIYDPTSSSLNDLYKVINKINAICDVPKEEKKEEKLNFEKKLKYEDNYICYSYEDFNNCISIGNIKELYFIEDEEGNKILFDKEGLGFIVEILSKFSK